MDPQLLVYVQQARNAGMSDDQIGAQLRGQGWQEAAISEALGLGDANAAVPELGRPDGLPPGQYEPDTSVPVRSGSRRPLIIAGVLFGVLAIGAAFFAALLATNTWSPLWSPFRPEPREVLGTAVLRSLNTALVSVNFRYNFSVEGDDLEGEIWADGTVDVRDKAIPKSRFDLGLHVQDKSETFIKREGTVIAVGSRTWGKEVWRGPSPFDGVRLPQEEDWLLLRGGERPGQQYSGWHLLNVLGDFGVESLEQIEELPEEEFEGFPVYRYRTTVQKEQLASIFESLDTTVSGSFSLTDWKGEVGGNGVEDLFFRDIEEVAVEVLVEKRSGLPVRLVLEQEGVRPNRQGRLSVRAELTLRYPLALSEEISEPEGVVASREEVQARRDQAYESLQEEVRERFDYTNLLTLAMSATDVSARERAIPGQCIAVGDNPEISELLAGLPLSTEIVSNIWYGSGETANEFVFRTLLPEGNEFLNGLNEKDGTVLGCDCEDPFFCIGS